jgi:hypothetical protein
VVTHGDHAPQLGNNRTRRASQGSVGDALARCVRRARAVGLVPGHDVPRHKSAAGQIGMVAHTEEVGGRVIVVVGGYEPEPRDAEIMRPGFSSKNSTRATPHEDRRPAAACPRRHQKAMACCLEELATYQEAGEKGG